MSSDIIPFNERQGVPSASRLMRLKLCPGSYWLEKKIFNNNLASKPTPDAERGTRIHNATKAIAMDEDVSKFHPATSSDEITEAWRLFGIYKRIENAVFPNINDQQQSIIEERFWLLDEDGIKALSGQIDIGQIVFNAEKKIWEALICDYKTGWGEVDSADTNLQMRGYAVLLKANYPELKNITVAIIAPKTGKPTLTRYEEEDLKSAKYEVLEILREALVHEAPRIAGSEQCKYCSAKLHCSAYKENFLAPVPVVREFTATAKEWTPETRARFCEVLPEITRWLEDRKSELKELTQSGNVPGWFISEGSKRKKITDPQEAYRRVADIMLVSTFTKACSVSLPKLCKAYANFEGINEKIAKESLFVRLKDLIEETQDEGKLEKVK